MLLHLQLFCYFLLALTTGSCQSNAGKNKPEDVPLSFKELLVQIREQKINPEKAEFEFKRIIKEIKLKYPYTPYDSLSMDLVFPLKKKNYRSVGGRGRGYYARQFDLFDHSIAKSHPAHDIFIYDLDKDDKDDTENEYVDVLAVNDGIVIATESNWNPETGYRGGNYIWLFDTESGGLWYYAHQRKVYAVEGQIVKQGDKIGEVGRTGFNATTDRSDTHLHLMYLKIDEDNNPMPVNHYPWLKKARTVYKTQLPEHYPRRELTANTMSSKKAKPVSTSFNSFRIQDLVSPGK